MARGRYAGETTAAELRRHVSGFCDGLEEVIAA